MSCPDFWTRESLALRCNGDENLNEKTQTMEKTIQDLEARLTSTKADIEALVGRQNQNLEKKIEKLGGSISVSRLI